MHLLFFNHKGKGAKVPQSPTEILIIRFSAAPCFSKIFSIPMINKMVNKHIFD